MWLWVYIYTQSHTCHDYYIQPFWLTALSMMCYIKLGSICPLGSLFSLIPCIWSTGMVYSGFWFGNKVPWGVFSLLYICWAFPQIPFLIVGGIPLEPLYASRFVNWISFISLCRHQFSVLPPYWDYLMTVRALWQLSVSKLSLRLSRWRPIRSHPDCYDHFMIIPISITPLDPQTWWSCNLWLIPP